MRCHAPPMSARSPECIAAAIDHEAPASTGLARQKASIPATEVASAPGWPRPSTARATSAAPVQATDRRRSLTSRDRTTAQMSPSAER
jgi:hypothetical protein